MWFITPPCIHVRMYTRKNVGNTIKTGGNIVKKILVLLGSPHHQGSTARMLEYFLAGFSGKDWEIEIFDAYQEKPSPCLACGWCASHEECAVTDSLSQLDSVIRDSDLLVVASPVYNLSFPAPLKAVIDRFQRYFEARFSLGLRPPIQKSRKAVLLASAGSDSTEGVEIMEKQLRLCFSVMNTQLEGSAVWLSTDKGETGWEKAKLALERLSLAISAQI